MKERKDITHRFVKSYYKLVGLERIKTKKEFCALVNTRSSSFKNMEDGNRHATVENIYNLHIKFGVSLNWLFTETGDFLDEK